MEAESGGMKSKRFPASDFLNYMNRQKQHKEMHEEEKNEIHVTEKPAEKSVPTTCDCCSRCPVTNFYGGMNW